MARPPQRQSIWQTWIIFLFGNPKHTLIGIGGILAAMVVWYWVNNPEEAHLLFQAILGIIITLIGVSMIIYFLFLKKEPPPKKKNSKRGRH